MNEPEEVLSQKGNPIQRKISIDYISFSAHVDYSQNSEFIELVKAQHVVRLHFRLHFLLTDSVPGTCTW
jgi:cleavage and polyadenylation specificity factor subunit 3